MDTSTTTVVSNGVLTTKTYTTTPLPVTYTTGVTKTTVVSNGVITTKEVTTTAPVYTQYQTETEIVTITYTGAGQTFTTYLTNSGAICSETVTVTVTTTCPQTTVAQGGGVYTTTVTIITTHTVYPEDWEDDGYEGEGTGSSFFFLHLLRRQLSRLQLRRKPPTLYTTT